MGRNVLWVLGLAALVGGLALWLRLPTDGIRGGALVAPAAQAGEGENDAAATLSPAQLPDGTERVTAEGRPQGAPALPDPSAGSPTALPAPNVRRLAGRVSVLDAAGAPLPEASGTFFLAFAGRARTDTRPVHFERGDWSLALESEHDWTHVEVRVPTVDGLTARLERPLGEVLFSPEEPLDLVLRQRPPAVLRVLDAQTGRELDGVCVTGLSSPLLRGATYPGRLANFDCGRPRQPSPVDIDPLQGGGADAFLFVGAPGYAWRRLTYDFVAGGTRTVHLERGASISIQGLFPGAEPRTFVRLYALRAKPAFGELDEALWSQPEHKGSPEELICEALLAHGPLEVRDLAPGTYRAALEVGVRPTPAGVLAERSVELVPGAGIRVQLVGEPPSERNTATLAGTVRAPDNGRVLERLPLVFAPEEAEESLARETFRVDARPTGESGPGWREFAWSIAHAPVGRLRIEIPLLGFRASFDLPPGGRDDLRIEVPALAILSVGLAQDSRGPRQGRPMLRWEHGTHADSLFGAPQRVQWLGAMESWRIAVPAGPVRLSVISPGEGYCEHRIELVPGEQELTLRLNPISGLRLRLLEGGTPVDLPPAHDVRLRPLGPRGRLVYVEGNAFTRTLSVDEPGTYRLELPRVPGYQAIGPTLVELTSGRVTELVVELVPERE